MGRRQKSGPGGHGGRTSHVPLVAGGTTKTMKGQLRTASPMANRKWHRVRTVPLAIFLLPLAMPSRSLQAKVLDRTVATVNNQAIMLSEFEKNAAPILE